LSREKAATFPCGGERLLGVFHAPDTPPQTGLVVVVGGPQYRVGSHRQFRLLADELASHGIAVLRFDCRGMGDSEGEFPGFEHIEPDVAAAVEAMAAEFPSLRSIALWGLCDATQAICRHASRDRRIAGVVLLNPWVRSEESYARTQLRHYYLSRLTDREFLSKLVKGQLDLKRSGRALFASLSRALGAARSRRGEGEDGRSTNPLAQRMAVDLSNFRGRILLILSGADLTAKEFELAAAGSTMWQKLLAEKRLTRQSLPAADHTFSRREYRDRVAQWTREWLGLLSTDGGRP